MRFHYVVFLLLHFTTQYAIVTSTELRVLRKDEAMTEDELRQYENQFRTRLTFAYEFRIAYATLADRVRKGQIKLHFVDNKVQINVAEALKACERKPRKSKKLANDLFSAA